MVRQLEMRSEMDNGSLISTVSYNPYDTTSMQNRTPWTIKIDHLVRMKEEPKHRLQKARADAGFKSPAEAARAIREINQHTLTSHENGNRPISKRAAEQYASVFGVRAGWLLFGEGGEPQTPLDRLRQVLAKAASKPPELQERIIDFAEFEIERYERSRETAT
jgi:hypothetical protein